MRNTLSRRKRGRRLPRRLQKGVYTHPSQVPGIIFRARGRGPKVITGLRKGAMTNQAVKLGYITEGQAISDIPKSKMDDFAIDLAKAVGSTRAMRMFNAQIVLRKNQSNGFKSKMIIAKGTLRRKSRVLKVRTEGAK